MLKLQMSTGYALKVLGYLYKNGNALTKAGELAEELDVTCLFLMKVLSTLRDHKMISSVQGCHGGYQLAKKAEDITVYDVLRAVEGEITLFPLQPDKQDPDNRLGDCFCHVQSQLIQMLKQVTIEMLFGPDGTMLAEFSGKSVSESGAV